MNRCLLAAVSLAAVFAVFVLASSAPPAQAKPPYLATFKREYINADNAKSELAKNADCRICHTSTKKGEASWNRYGEDVKAALVGKKAVDAGVLKAVAGKPSGVEDKTYGDLIKEGKLPAGK